MFQTTNQYRLVQEKSLTSSQRKKLHITSWPGCRGHSDSTWFVTYGLRTHLQSIQSHPISGLFPLAPIEHEQKVRQQTKTKGPTWSLSF